MCGLPPREAPRPTVELMASLEPSMFAGHPPRRTVPLQLQGPLVDMRWACKYADRMPVMVQIRNVPSELHRELKARAALEGMSLSEYLLRELRHALERPSLDEIRKRLSRRQPVRPHPAPAAAVRAERKSR